MKAGHDSRVTVLGRPERRLQERFPSHIELRVKQLTSLGFLPGEPDAAIRGQIQNISGGGICLLSGRSIAGSSLVRCEITVSGTGAAIPTLMQVRWTQVSVNGYEIGLQFVL